MGTRYELRPDQIDVFRDLAAYVQDAANRTVADEDVPPMGRIIIPSRIGKTVIAGRYLDESRMTATFVVPTKLLVEQAAGEFRKMLPGRPIGYHYADGKALVEGGVNIITYQSLVSFWKNDGELPAPIANSGVVFADEGHVSMTAKRMAVMLKGFSRKTPRVAMTATPDYGTTPDRDLASHFPELIHELPLIEAMELELLAPVRIWVAEVDTDASRVKMVAGNYDEGELGEIMSAAPFFEAARRFRYSKPNAVDSALICCSSRPQARALLEYFLKFGPKDRPRPALIDGNTPKDERRAIAEKYDAGGIDTIINVRTMLTGWNSPRCKLLIDLAPSTSHVLAMQKYFRPLTRWGEREAKIFLLIPASLPRIPVLPTDFFYFGKAEYEAGALIGGKDGTRPSNRPEESTGMLSAIEHVTLKSRIVLTQRFERPTLDPKDYSAIEEVILSNPEFTKSPLCGYRRFRWLYFSYASFKGHGWQLLRYVGVKPDKLAYVAFMAKMFAESASDHFVKLYGSSRKERDMETDGEEDPGKLAIAASYPPEMWKRIPSDQRRNIQLTDFSSFSREIVLYKEDTGLLRRALEDTLAKLTVRQEFVVCLRFGFGISPRVEKGFGNSCRFPLPNREMTLGEVAAELGVTMERIRRIIMKAFRLIRHPSRAQHLKSFLE